MRGPVTSIVYCVPGKGGSLPVHPDDTEGFKDTGDFEG